MTTLWWQQAGLVALGGAFGAVGRFWLGERLLRQLGESWPWGTFVANMIGAFAVGAAFVWLEGKGASAPYWRAFLIVGLLGGLTTYSSLMLECLLFAKSNRGPLLLSYLAASLIVGMCLVWLGARAMTVLKAT